MQLVTMTLASFFARLEDHGASFNWNDSVGPASKDLVGDTPLHWAAFWGECEAIESLVAEGANVNEPGEFGYTPLHMAIEAGRLAAIHVLLVAGASPTVPDAAGVTPLEFANSTNQLAAAKLLGGCI
jgi:ankyrin repeat protein